MKEYIKKTLGKAKDLSMNKYGRLTPQYRTENIGRKTAWVCKCDCGNITIVTADAL